MGGDGGSVPRRIELVKQRAKDPKAADAELLQQALWQRCALSNEPLQAPIVADLTGRLYNKEAVLDLLLQRKLAKSRGTDGPLKHVRGLRDLHKLSLTPSAGGTNSTFQCPVTQQAMDGATGAARFVFLLPCGCVFSDAALRNVPTATTCFVCGTPFLRGQRWSAASLKTARATGDAAWTPEVLAEIRTRYSTKDLGDVVVLNPREPVDVAERDRRLALHSAAAAVAADRKKSAPRKKGATDTGASR